MAIYNKFPLFAGLLYNCFMIIEQMNHDEQLVQIFKALADPTRLEIIRTLYRSGREMNCGEVGEQCEASKSNASYHFRLLREAGLITVRKESQSKFITLNLKTFETFLPCFLTTL